MLDRILFCAFCEDRNLLPPETVSSAFTHSDPYNPKPIWENFRGLFRSVDVGNAGLKIPAYNGGLFAHDPGLDPLQVPDDVCALFKDLADYDFRPAREADYADLSQEIRAVIDPACGSGAFLIETFDQLHAHYETSNARLEELRGHRSLFELDRNGSPRSSPFGKNAIAVITASRTSSSISSSKEWNSSAPAGNSPT